VVLISLSEMIKSFWHMLSTWILSLTSMSCIEHFNALRRHETIERLANEFLQMGPGVSRSSGCPCLVSLCNHVGSWSPTRRCWCTCELRWRSILLLACLPHLLDFFQWTLSSVWLCLFSSTTYQKHTPS
jgi:hypothetical protein